MTFHYHSHPRSFIAILLLLSLVVVWGVSCNTQTPFPSPSAAPTNTFSPTLSPTQAPTQTPYIITATASGPTPDPAPEGTYFLALADAGYTHLFAYSPQTLSLTRLTMGECNDVDPALSPEKTQLAYASDCNGYWNIYVLNLSTGSTVPLTDSPEYKGHPSWSLPDGAFITYDTYVNGSLEVFVRSVTDFSFKPINLTHDPGLDTQPAWSPQGREIAFVSNRSGEPEIWVSNLDVAGSFTDVSRNPNALESHPAWSPDGTRLAWSATDNSTGVSGIYIWDSTHPDTPAQWIGSGSLPFWQDATHLAAGLITPNQYYLTSFNLAGVLRLAPVLLPGPLEGLTYGEIVLPMPGPFRKSAEQTPTGLYAAPDNPQPGGVSVRVQIVTVNGLQAPYPELQSLAVDSFQALRGRVAHAVGWDALASLENAFIPLTTSLDPGLGEDWLYTGRAFTLNPALLNAGMMAAVREDFNQQTYWHIFLRTKAQDGSEGAPLDEVPWDFSARTGTSSAYENGGQLMARVPSGYWFDLTTLAQQYGWQRLPALTNWRTYFAGAHYNELAYTQGLDWRSAMLQLYPAEILITPTVVIPPTRTPTRTPLWFQSPTPTRTPTNHPTYTP